MEHNFVNFHVLISHSPSCLNRDDMNMQKTAIFGGKRRVRISSQSLKRTMRKSAYAVENLGNASLRTKRFVSTDGTDDLKTYMVRELEARFDADLVLRAIHLMTDKDLTVSKEVIGDAVAPWIVEEVAWFCDQITEADHEGLTEKALLKKLKNELAAMRKALSSGIDVALFGRMATSGMMTELGKIDGALAVAHTITTHTVDPDMDWFTAVDDLQELGSGHLDTQEFSSGVFYRYASLNLAQLQSKLGNCSRNKTLSIAAHVMHLLATEVPSAKQQSFAAHNLADFAMTTLSHLPISLANAFERPVNTQPQGGFRIPSIEALHHYWARIHTGYGLDEKCAAFSIDDVDMPSTITPMTTLAALESWLRHDGEVN